MKLFPNLAASLRFYFGVARALTLFMGAVWFLVLVCAPLIRRNVDDAKLMVSVGDISFETPPGSVKLTSSTAKPDSLKVARLRGALDADLISKDSALSSALRWTMFPTIVLFVTLTWLLMTALRAICANIECGEVFTETNVRLVRNAGVILIVYSIAGFAVNLWSAHSMNSYLVQHVSLIGLGADPQLAGALGKVHFTPASSMFPGESGFVIGLVILLLAQAFRQGLNLKTENDLTV